jgi:hypothetical protein
MKKQSIRAMLAGVIAIPMLALGVSFLNPVTASADVTCADGTPAAKEADCPDPLKGGASAAKGDQTSSCLFSTTTPACTGVFTTITNVALFIIGAISVLMLIYGGIRYTISGGDAKNVTAAKDTILYAVVGLVVAILAYAIVNFVITRLA